MTASPARSPRFSAVLGVTLLATAAAVAVGYELADLASRIERLQEQVASREKDLAAILGEITRIRIEQSSDKKGPDGLLEKLRTYAPILVDARTTQPDFLSAQKEMDSVLKAFAAIGPEAWAPIRKRMDALQPDKNFDELKWLLEAGLRTDRAQALILAREMLLGTKFPSPRLRWYAADVLTREDKPVAQIALRQILTTESSRGVDMERAQAYGATIPDKLAFATSGFHNFIEKYVRTEDPQTEPTLLMVMGRAEHDMITVQRCIEELGKRRCAAAVEPIQRLYQNPPGNFQNPLFLTKCLDALAQIQGEAARPFFEAMLPKANTGKVADHLKHLLTKN